MRTDHLLTRAFLLVLVALAGAALPGEAVGPVAIALSTQGPPAVAGPSQSQVIIQAGQSDESGEIVLTHNNLGIKLSAPLDKKAGLADFVSLDGLANNLALAVTWKHAFIPSGDAAAVATGLEGVCKELGLNLQQVNCDTGVIEKALRDGKASEAEIVRKLIEVDRLVYGGNWAWVLHAEGRAGYKKFDFFDLAASKQQSDEISSSFSLSGAGTYGPGRLLLSATYQQAFADSKVTGQSCVAISGAPGLESCKSLPVGGPTERNGIVARAELRHNFGAWGVAPTVSWDEHDDVIGVSLPVYFLRNIAGALDGGFRLGWRDDTDDLTAAVFVSKPL